MSIEVQHITKTYGTFCALNDVNATIPDGQIVALLGPSGSGKTTLLRIIAGLEFQDEGVVLFNGEDATRLRARDRRVGFVFQHYALFRHMTVLENVAFGLRVKPRPLRPTDGEIRRRVRELLQLVQLDWLADRYPSQLSGGQRQRVALARALAVEPSVLLLDEPFGALDAKVRKELRRWLRRLHDEIHVTSVFVTHDVEEALEVADRVIVMNEGRIDQAGTPEEVYENPANPFVYHFLGNVNLFHGRISSDRIRIASPEDPAGAAEPKDGAPAVAFVRPHDIEISLEPTEPDTIAAVIGHIYPAGPEVRLELDGPGAKGSLDVVISRARHAELALKPGDRVFLSIRRFKVFPDHPVPLAVTGGCTNPVAERRTADR